MIGIHVMLLALFACLCLPPAPALADDNNYVMAIENDSSDTVVVSIDPWHEGGEHSSCIGLAPGTNFKTGYTISPTRIRFIGFWRASQCSGKQGWLGIAMRPTSVAARPPALSTVRPTLGASSDDYQQFWFDTHGNFEKQDHNSEYHNVLEVFPNTRVIEDTVSLTFHIVNPSVVTAERAAQQDCYSDEELKTLAGSFLPPAHAGLGSVTESKLTAYRSSITNKSTTREEVTYPDTRVYRAPTIAGEEAAYVEGHIISKAQKRLTKLTSPADIADFWASFGPDLATHPNPNLATILRLLATGSSDSPPSQFVSLALTEQVARLFGSTIYAFRLTPNSPVLGLRGCALNTGGEVQYQAMGGTPIHDLYRSKGPNNWEVFDFQSKIWRSSLAPAGD
jgi:hypothetical protein